MYGYGAIKHFPKHERHVLGAELRSSMINLQRLIVTAIKRYHKKTTLTDLDIQLSVLIRQVRLAKDLKYIDLRKYEIWAKLLLEIGKMIGGWMKSVNNKVEAL